MREITARPLRSLRHELYLLLEVMAIPISLALIFPYEILMFRPQVDSSPPLASCAFLTLADDEVARLVADARAAWRVSGGTAQGRWVTLSMEEIPEEAPRAVMSIGSRQRVSMPEPLTYTEATLPPSAAAGEPVKLAPSAARTLADNLPFSRNELLNIDSIKEIKP